MLTGLKDIDREVLKWVEDVDVLNACAISRKMWCEVFDDAFIRRRLSKYPDIEKCKYESESWKSFYALAVRSITSMKRRFNFDYTDGNFKEQHRLLTLYKDADLSQTAAENGLFSLMKYAIHIDVERPILCRYADAKLAAKKGHLEIVKWMMEKFPLKGYINEYLFDACSNGRLGLVKYLIENGAKVIGLTTAARNGHYAIVQYLVEHGANINANNPLKSASIRGSSKIVKYFIENGADIHAEDDIALKYAVQYNNLDLVKFLVEHGADIYSRDDEAIRYAKHKRFQEIIDYLSQFY